jgi:hypothetical protein
VFFLNEFWDAIKVVIVIGRCSKSENHPGKKLANFGYESAIF